MRQIIIDIRSEHENEISEELWGLLIDGGIAEHLIEECSYDLDDSLDDKNKRWIITESE